MVVLDLVGVEPLTSGRQDAHPALRSGGPSLPAPGVFVPREACWDWAPELGLSKGSVRWLI